MRVWSLALVVVLLAALATPSPAPFGKKGKGLKALKGLAKVGLALGVLGSGGGNLKGLATIGKILAVGGVGLGALALKGGNNHKRKYHKPTPIVHHKPATIIHHQPATIIHHKPVTHHVYHKPATTHSYYKRPATYARSYGKTTSYGGYYRG